MARLRKASPLEPSIILQQSKQTRPRRSSPRKAVREVDYRISSDEDEENIPLRPKPSKRDLSDLPSVLHDSFYTSKSHASPSHLPLTPRRQRVLRPVESNSRLLRKLSHESLASPEKRLGSERRARRDRSETNEQNLDTGRTRNFTYTKSLVRSVAGRELRKANSRVELLDEAGRSLMETPEAKIRTTEAHEIDSELEEETSILCGTDADVAQEVEEQQVESDSPEDRTFGKQQEDEEDEEDEVLLPIRSIPKRMQRCVESDSESDRPEVPEPDHEHEERLVQEPQPLMCMRLPHSDSHSTIQSRAEEVIDSTGSPRDSESFVLPEPTRARSSSLAISRPATASSEEVHPILTYSPTPTKKRSPYKAPPVSSPTTPPLVLPRPTKLVSPSKKKNMIPKAPELRPSLDAFWNPEVVNDWNDRHSPAKKLVSPRKQQWRSDISKMTGGLDLDASSGTDEEYTSPVSSPKKKTFRSKGTNKEPDTSAGPTVKELKAQRKAFAERKHDMATSFLTELDNTICFGTIAQLSESTGGIKVIWSNTLKTTAGRANWRREVIRVNTPSGPPIYTTETRHHCSIELASKVIDDSRRLYNVLAHEFCHLLTFMISEVRNNPHGAEFKAWGRKVSIAFAQKGVEVTTKHSYVIEYKFVWECISCGYEFKRHSRSVDPKRHSCGKCKGRLVQTKPAPRIGAAGKDGEGATKSDYQVFVKKHFKQVKQDLATQGLDTPMGKVMEIVAKKYREQKAKDSKESNLGVQSLSNALSSLIL